MIDRSRWNPWGGGKRSRSDDHASSHGEAPAYVLGALDAAARERFEAHAAACDVCRDELESLLPVAARLAQAVPQHEPPSHLAAQVLARVQTVAPAPVPESTGTEEWAAPFATPAAPLPAGSGPAPARRPRWQWWRTKREAEPRLAVQPLREVQPPRGRSGDRTQRITGVVAAASLFVALASAGYAFAAHQQVQQTSNTAAQLVETLAIMYQPGRVARPLSGTDATPYAKGMLYMVPELPEAVVVAYDLPRLRTGECYQFWLNNLDENVRVSGGIFKVDEKGRGRLIVRSPDALVRYRTMGVTREPWNGSPKPTGTRVLAGSIH